MFPTKIKTSILSYFLFCLDNITLEELNTISPFGNTADIIEVKGRVLKQAFEHGVGHVEDLKGRFPQVSGKVMIRRK